jgi:hypothetical protein
MGNVTNAISDGRQLMTVKTARSYNGCLVPIHMRSVAIGIVNQNNPRALRNDLAFLIAAVFISRSAKILEIEKNAMANIITPMSNEVV